MKPGNWKRVLVSLLSVALLASFCACGGEGQNGGSSTQGTAGSSANESSVSQEEAGAPVPMRYVAPGSEFAMQDEVLAKVNEKLQADGVNIEVEIQRIPWDA